MEIPCIYFSFKINLLNFSEFNELIVLYDELKKEINNLNTLNPSMQSIIKIKTLTIDLDNKIQQLKTMVVITALMYTGKIKNCLKYKNYKKFPKHPSRLPDNPE